MENTILTVFFIALGGSLGAGARYWLSGLFKDVNSPLPLGTLAVNVLGSFTLGFFMTISTFAYLPYEIVKFLGTGFLGAFTTMSTFAVETLSLNEQSMRFAFINIVIMIIFVLIGTIIGINIITYVY